MSKPTTIKDAIKKWEDAHPGQNIADATEVEFQFQWPPIEKMDNSLAALTNCRYKQKQKMFMHRCQLCNLRKIAENLVCPQT